MKRFIFLIAITVLIITGCEKANNELIKISIINLITNPEKYHNKDITIIGVGNLQFEGNKICLSKSDVEYGISSNCLWIELNEKISYEEAKTLNGKYIIIEGTFDMKNNGHFGMYPGAIVDITRYELWEDKFVSQ